MLLKGCTIKTEFLCSKKSSLYLYFILPRNLPILGDIRSKSGQTFARINFQKLTSNHHDNNGIYFFIWRIGCHVAKAHGSQCSKGKIHRRYVSRLVRKKGIRTRNTTDLYHFYLDGRSSAGISVRLTGSVGQMSQPPDVSHGT